MKWSETLLNWYYENKRELPWRKTDDPYHIWLSEIILQQTRVDQGLSYYKKFIQNYPTVFDLAAAKEDEVLKLWQGLGYYSRARNLHASAQWVVDKNKGVFPQTFKQLLLLKGLETTLPVLFPQFVLMNPKPLSMEMYIGFYLDVLAFQLLSIVQQHTRNLKLLLLG